MKNRLKGEETYKSIDEESDVICLLLLIKSTTYSYETKSYPVLEIHMALRKLYSTYQSNSSFYNEYLNNMTNLRDVISHCGGVVCNRPFLINKLLKAAKQADLDNPTDENMAVAKTATEEAYMATAFLSGLN